MESTTTNWAETDTSTGDKQRRVKRIKPASFAPGMLLANLGELFRYFDLLYTLTVHRVKVRYKQSALGFGWAIVQPLTLMAVYTIIFTVFTRGIKTGSNTPYFIFVFAALLPWTFFQTSLSTASTGLVSHTQLITKVYFPREILPMTYVFAAIFDFCMAALVLAVMMTIYQVPIGPQILFAIPVMLVGLILAIGLSLLLSAFQVKYRDIGIAMPLLMQLWMFASPVVYPLSQVPERYRSLYVLNPMCGVVENFRRVVLEAKTPDWHSFSVSLIVCLIILPISYILFKQREATMADII